MPSVRISKELEQLKKSPTDFFEFSTQISDNEFTGKLIVKTLHNKSYKICIDLPSNYPFSPPQIQFIDLIEFPNEIIDNTIKTGGNICENFIKTNWSPTTTIIKLLEKISGELKKIIDNQ